MTQRFIDDWIVPVMIMLGLCLMVGAELHESMMGFAVQGFSGLALFIGGLQLSK